MLHQPGRASTPPSAVANVRMGMDGVVSGHASGSDSGRGAASGHHVALVAASYQRYRREVARIASTGEWGAYADLFEQDAVFHRTGMVEVRGRESIRSMILTETTTFPGVLIDRTEIVWFAVDVKRRRVVQEMRHVAADPGDGSEHFALAASMLQLGPGALWARVDVVHSPHAFRSMFRGWARAAVKCGRDEEAGRVLSAVDVAHPVV